MNRQVAIFLLLTAATCAAVLAFAYQQATQVPESDTAPLEGYVRPLHSPIVDPNCDYIEGVGFKCFDGQIYGRGTAD